MKRLQRFTTQNAVFMECDIQQVFAKHIYKYDQVAHNAKRLSDTGKLLNVPIIATRHVQKNFKDIDQSITQHPGRTIIDKTQFSMRAPPVMDQLK